MNQKTEEAGITFGIHNSTKSKQLVIEGPKKLMESMYVPLKVGRSYPFKLDVPEEDDTATWRLNATAIGRMNNAQRQSLSESLESANEFIGRVVQSIAEGEVAGDRTLNITKYTNTDQGFDFSAEVRKPSLEPAAAELVVKNSVMSITEDFGMRECQPQVQILESTGLNVVSGLNMAFGKSSSVKTIDQYENSFELLGRNVPEGKQPLIYLAGAVALAHADSLASE